jgi:hypothetical protein
LSNTDIPGDHIHSHSDRKSVSNWWRFCEPADLPY